MHLVDVNSIARQCLEQMSMREDEYQRNLKIAKQNEIEFEEEIKSCVKMDRVKALAWEALKKGRALQMLLDFNLMIPPQRLKRQAFLDLYHNAYEHLWLTEKLPVSTQQNRQPEGMLLNCHSNYTTSCWPICRCCS